MQNSPVARQQRIRTTVLGNPACFVASLYTEYLSIRVRMYTVMKHVILNDIFCVGRMLCCRVVRIPAPYSRDLGTYSRLRNCQT
jgi:hypothetical protein